LHHFAYRRGERYHASPIGAECHAAPKIIVVSAILRQFYWRYIARTASPIDPELAYNFNSTDWKWKYGKTKMKSK
jgi:hypothetical protein